MTRYNMLNEHLNMIYIVEDLNLPKIKARIKQIGAAVASRNILRFKQVFDAIPQSSISELSSVARKKMGPQYRESEKYVDMKMKGSPDKLKDAMVVVRSSLMRIKAESKDPNVQARVTEEVGRMDDLMHDVSAQMRAGGFKLVILAVILEFMFGVGTLIAPLFAAAGIILLAISLILHVMAFFVTFFIDAKRSGTKIISLDDEEEEGTNF